MKLQIVIFIMLASLNVWAGLQCRFSDLRAVLTDVWFIVRALVLSVVVVPLLALALTRVFGLAPEFATGVMAMAVAGGVPFLAFASSRPGGQLGAAVALVFVLSLASVVTAPFTLNALAAPMALHQVPVGKVIAQLLLAQLLPLVVGILIGSSAKPGVVAALVRILYVIVVAAIVVVLVLLGGKLAQAFAAVFLTKTIITIVLVVALSMLIAWVIGGPDYAKRVVLTHATGLRNPGLALLLANAAFPDPLVESTIIAYLGVQAISGMLAGILMKRSRR